MIISNGLGTFWYSFDSFLQFQKCNSSTKIPLLKISISSKLHEHWASYFFFTMLHFQSLYIQKDVKTLTLVLLRQTVQLPKIPLFSDFSPLWSRNFLFIHFWASHYLDIYVFRKPVIFALHLSTCEYIYTLICLKGLEF